MRRVGLGASSKIIVCAAAIMVAVAAGFALDTSVMIKVIGVGMATAILVDVTWSGWSWYRRRSRCSARRTGTTPAGSRGEEHDQIM